ncbi:four helix bundle protein [Vibrio europaeus]|uniref:four helix bundle protein n=1 Tax=Vibrio europaeus TaxID=300876 RepID=UPI00233F6B62|nr:four helix bundle protein [Vibrio europaeus]MDC5822919.1 four helix bundle protein [Vibrio europaeus]MDC5869552.1 four helix bundle protein [Vibrio europaeus]
MKYQNLDVWKMSFALCKHTYQSVAHIKDYSFKDQIRRSSLSVPSNIAEGIERNSPKETAYFLNIAKGSTGELKTQLLLAYEFGYINNSDCEALCEKCERISRMLYSLIARHKSLSEPHP